MTRLLVGTAAASAALAFICFANTVRAQDADHDGDDKEFFTSYSEVEVTKNAYFAYTQLFGVLNGDWSRPGLLMEAEIGAGPYNYHSPDLSGERVNATLISSDLMMGYHGSIGDEAAYWHILLGVDIEDNELHPSDPSNPVGGSQVGFKVAGEIEADDERKFYYDLNGEYTTAYQTYWFRSRVGYRFGTLTVGPEGTLFGDKTYDSQRIGGFLRFPLRLFRGFKPVAIIASGYEFVQEKDVGSFGEGFGGIAGSGPGPFGTASLEFDF
jgi:Cellulose biosynthesis protein BcsS